MKTTVPSFKRKDKQDKQIKDQEKTERPAPYGVPTGTVDQDHKRHYLDHVNWMMYKR